jgi:hypothetical protein
MGLLLSGRLKKTVEDYATYTPGKRGGPTLCPFEAGLRAMNAGDAGRPRLMYQHPITIASAKRGTLPDASGLLPMSVMSQRLGKHAMQTAYTVLILLTLVGVSRLLARLIPLPLPLVQIAAGALLA